MSLRVILLEPEKSGNIGAVARSMKNFGQRELWIVNPKAPIDGESMAYAMHGSDVLSSAKIVNKLKEALVGVDVIVGTSSIIARSPSNVIRTPTTPREFANKLNRCRGRIALVFGRESSGLNNEELGLCDSVITIPASHEYNVLNLATAVSIILYELFQQRRKISGEHIATRISKEQLLCQFEKLVTSSGTQAHRQKLAIRAFRNLTARAMISRREASLLIGVFRRAVAKIP